MPAICSPAAFLSRPMLLAVAAAVLLGPAPGHAQARRPPLPAKPAPAKPAPLPMPEVYVGGVQVVNSPFGDDDWSARPFNSRNGTRVVLVVKMPAGLGLIGIDDEKSRVDTFTDEQRTQYAAELDPFPDVSRDGSAGAIEIESDIVPGPSVTSLVAEGTLALVVAAGSKPVRVAKVPIENDRTFKIGATTVTVSDATVDEEEQSQSFTFNLTRQLLNSLRGVRFLDAKGQDIESSRTSSSYINESASVSYTIKTLAKSVTVEFDQWQGLRDLEVPFKVNVSLGLAR